MDIDSATHTSFYVNGQKAFTAITGMSYLPYEIRTFGTVQQPFKTRGSIPYDPQQYFSSMTDTYTDYILEFLSSQGVDTSREFVINGTHCELVNGKIREVGNDYVVPSAIQQKAVKRYEERMAQLLKDGNWYRMA